MKRMLSLVALALVVGTGVASAQTVKGGLGFHTTDAPLGIRWWLNPKIALDAAFGFGSDERVTGTTTESYSSMAFDIGVPISLKSWDRVNLMLRPGLLYTSNEVNLAPGPGTGDDTVMTLLAELEAEVFLAENLSVSASHGIGIVNSDPANGSSTSDYSTFGNNLTNVGFHIYLFGGSK